MDSKPQRAVDPEGDSEELTWRKAAKRRRSGDSGYDIVSVEKLATKDVIREAEASSSNRPIKPRTESMLSLIHI